MAKYLRPSIFNCPFCLELAHPPYARALLGDSWPFADRLLFASDDAVALAGYGPQVFPYALVLTRRHIVSTAETHAREREALLQCLSYLYGLKAFPGKSLTVFEHGGVDSDRCGCLEHCHLHVIDGRYDAVAWLRDDEPDCREVCLSVTERWQVQGRYIFAGVYADNHEVRGVLAQPDDVPRQYFRQLLARQLGERCWNWREGMNHDFIEALVSIAKETAGRGAVEPCPTLEKSCPVYVGGELTDVHGCR